MTISFSERLFQLVGVFVAVGFYTPPVFGVNRAAPSFELRLKFKRKIKKYNCKEAYG